MTSCEGSADGKHKWKPWRDGDTGEVVAYQCQECGVLQKKGRMKRVGS